MYKVLIADDEPKVCRLIEYAVDWKALGLEIVGVAENGIQALEFILEHSVDIVITDIRMPGYDGLELIRRAKEINPHIGFVIISGHRQFDYAQKAIHYGVDDYLLKPIDENELARILRKMVAGREIDREEEEHQTSIKRQLEKDSERMRQSFIELLISAPQRLAVPLTLEAINEEYRCHFQEGIYQVVVVKADIARRERHNEAYQLLERQVQHITETELLPGSKELLSFVGTEGVYFLLNIDQEYEKELRQRLKRVRTNIRTLRDLFWEIQVTVGVGHPIQTLADIEVSISSARRAILNRIYLGVNHTMGALEQSEDTIKVTTLADAKTRFELIENIETLNEDAVLKVLTNIKQNISRKKGMDGETLLLLCLELVDALVLSLKKMCADATTLHLKAKFQQDFHMCTTVDEVFELLGETFIKGISDVAQAKEQSETKPIRSARKYIQEHYNESVKLEDVSSLIGFNPNYFSGMFKQQTGMNFSEYLTHVRIEKAKQFLIQGKLFAADIAIQIGYGDAKYFYKIFKKSTGLTPMEFGRLYQKMD